MGTKILRMGRSHPLYCKHGVCLDPGDECFGLKAENCIQCEEKFRPSGGKMKEKPTIHELEKILASEEPCPIVVNPDGSISAVDEGVLTELQGAITAPDDIDSVKVTVEQGLLRRACMQIRRLRAELIRQQAPVEKGLAPNE